MNNTSTSGANGPTTPKADGYGLASISLAIGIVIEYLARELANLDPEFSARFISDLEKLEQHLGSQPSPDRYASGIAFLHALRGSLSGGGPHLELVPDPGKVP